MLSLRSTKRPEASRQNSTALPRRPSSDELPHRRPTGSDRKMIRSYAIDTGYRWVRGSLMVPAGRHVREFF